MSETERTQPIIEEPQSERGAPGSRDTGSDQPGEGPVNRPAGSFNDDEVTSAENDDPSQTNLGGTGELPPQNTEPAIPPYDNRKKTADPLASDSLGHDAETGGAAQQVADSDYKSAPPGATSGGATASPADEQPATSAPETEPHDEGADLSHQSGVRAPEDLSRET